MEKEEISFEQAMQELEEITRELEKGDLTLDESVKKFEKGMEVSKKCNEMLEDAEKRITMLIKQEDGFVEEDFIPEG